VGFKGTHGLVPVQGVIPLAWSLDHVGVLTRSVADAALAMSVLTGLDLEPSAVSAPRLALAPELVVRASREVAAHIEAIIDAFARAGATVSKIELPPLFRDLPAAGLTVLEAEAAAYHEARFLKHADEYSPPGRRAASSESPPGASGFSSSLRPRCLAHSAVFDLKIEGAEVIDGTGRPGSRADVGIRDDKIVAIGDLHREPAGRNLHASG